MDWTAPVNTLLSWIPAVATLLTAVVAVRKLRHEARAAEKASNRDDQRLELDRQKTALDTYRALVDDICEEMRRLKAEQVAMEKRHAEEISALKERYDREIAELKRQHQQEREELQRRIAMLEAENRAASARIHELERNGKGTR